MFMIALGGVALATITAPAAPAAAVSTARLVTLLREFPFSMLFLIG
jgi:hypothetical protein